MRKTYHMPKIPMTDGVIVLDLWYSTMERCTVCCADWAAVFAPGFDVLTPLECPECGALAGRPFGFLGLTLADCGGRDEET